MNTLYNTCKQQISVPSNIYDLGQITCRIVQTYFGEVNSTISKIQSLILKPAHNLLKICKFEENLFNLWELPSFSQGLLVVKSGCDALPILSAINLIGSTSLQHIPYIKTPVALIQSSCALKSSLKAISSSAKISQTNKLDEKNTIVQGIVNSLQKIDSSLQKCDQQAELYKACRTLEKLIPQISESVDSDPSKNLEMFNKIILNSKDINKKFSSSEISKLKEMLNEIIKKGGDLTLLNKIPDQFKAHLDTVVRESDTKSLLEVLKCAINWILGASNMINLFFIGGSIPVTALLSLEVCSFIVRLAILFYKNHLASISNTI